MTRRKYLQGDRQTSSPLQKRTDPENYRPREQRPKEQSLPKAEDLTEDVKSKTRLIEPNFTPKATTRPHITTLLGSAYSILGEEFRLLHQKVADGTELTVQESNKLAKYVDSLAKLAREEREQEKKTDPANLSDEELMDLLPEILEKLGLDKALGKGGE